MSIPCGHLRFIHHTFTRNKLPHACCIRGLQRLKFQNFSHCSLLKYNFKCSVQTQTTKNSNTIFVKQGLNSLPSLISFHLLHRLMQKQNFSSIFTAVDCCALLTPLQFHYFVCIGDGHTKFQVEPTLIYIHFLSSLF